MALGDRRKSGKQFVPIKLHVTAMMDMFTIILIFLLFSFSNEPETVVLDKTLKLPTSSTELVYKENLKIVLSQKSVKLGEKVIASLKDGKIVGLDNSRPEQSDLFIKLKLSLIETGLRSNGENFILFLCDKRLPFETINNVIKAAVSAGYPNFKFTTLQGI